MQVPHLDWPLWSWEKWDEKKTKTVTGWCHPFGRNTSLESDGKHLSFCPATYEQWHERAPLDFPSLRWGRHSEGHHMAVLETPLGHSPSHSLYSHYSWHWQFPHCGQLSPASAWSHYSGMLFPQLFRSWKVVPLHPPGSSLSTACSESFGPLVLPQLSAMFPPQHFSRPRIWSLTCVLASPPLGCKLESSLLILSPHYLVPCQLSKHVINSHWRKK